MQLPTELYFISLMLTKYPMFELMALFARLTLLVILHSEALVVPRACT